MKPYNGKPCKFGHKSPRYVIGGACVWCKRARAKAQRKASGRTLANWINDKMVWDQRGPSFEEAFPGLGESTPTSSYITEY